MSLISTSLHAKQHQTLKLDKTTRYSATVKRSFLFEYPIEEPREITVQLTDYPFKDYDCELDGYISGTLIVMFTATEMICYSEDKEYRTDVSVEGYLHFKPKRFKTQHIGKGHIIMLKANLSKVIAVAGVRG